MRGCAGASSTQAHTPISGGHPSRRSTLASTFYGFRVLSNSDRAPVFLFVVLRLVGSGSWLLAWRPANLEPAGPVQTRRVQGLDLGLVRSL